MNEDGDSTGGHEEVSHEREYRTRANDGDSWRTTFFILGGGIFLFGFCRSVFNGLLETIRSEVRFAHTERIERDKQFNEELFRCGGKR